MDSPQLDFEARKVASISSSCLLSTVSSTTHALLLLLGRTPKLKPVPYCYQMDLMAGRLAEVHVPGGVDEIDRDPARFAAQR
jgi:hypothetical protein